MALSVFADINTQLKEKVPRSGRAHDKYRAVFIGWESTDDNSTWRSEARELSGVLEKGFGFKSRTITIPLGDSLNSLKSRLGTILDSETSPSSCLWLLHYSGTGNEGKEAVFWPSVLESMADMVSDIVVLADFRSGVFPKPLATIPALDPEVSNNRVCELLVGPTGLPEGSQSFTKEICRVLDTLREPHVNIMALRSKLVVTTGGGKWYEPSYSKLSQTRQSNLLEQVGTTIELRVALRRPLDEDALDDLVEWAQRKPPEVKRIVFSEAETDTIALTDTAGGPNDKACLLPASLLEFILSVSTADLNLLDSATWYDWLGSAPNSIDTPRYHVRSGFAHRRLSKSAGDEEIESQLEDFVRRRNREESWRNHDSRLGHYSRVIVLPLIWEIPGFHPELRVLQDLKHLANTFRDVFGFTVEQVFNIPVGRDISGQRALEERIRDLVEEKRGPNVLGAGDLVIIIYSGHGSNTVHSTGKAVWSSGPVPNSGSPPYRETIDWSEIQPYLDRAECDVAQILDCCHAASAAKDPDDRGRNEILAACVRESRTIAGPDCFCRIVARTIKRLARGGDPFCFRDLAHNVDQEVRKMNRSAATETTIPTPYFKQVSEHMSSIKLRPRHMIGGPGVAGVGVNGAQRPPMVAPSVPSAIDRNVVAEVFVVLSLNSQMEEVKREHVTKNELLRRLGAGGA
ncbi:hypothetical protein QBC37DRAFT_480212 [Rhypophila decipiens]|uniref:Peptidase C14 caspase domain-containing protein n=1 Tax=Rhypophila decipiens TaxID=261697 RepID=A0AAN6YIP4_9PEZI|nr:hypothetical protein QBC37DRAFT_480212 [Rhypophila decipiens]